MKTLTERLPDKPIRLSSGRTITHTIQPNGSQLATPEAGPAEMTESEWQEYCQILATNTAP